jgi:hypothetical protein
MSPRVFRRYLGIHYSGAETPDSGLKNLRVYSATPETPPLEDWSRPGVRKFWSHHEMAHWLAGELDGCKLSGSPGVPVSGGLGVRSADALRRHALAQGRSLPRASHVIEPGTGPANRYRG